MNGGALTQESCKFNLLAGSQKLILRGCQADRIPLSVSPYQIKYLNFKKKYYSKVKHFNEKEKMVKKRQSLVRKTRYEDEEAYQTGFKILKYQQCNHVQVIFNFG